MDLELSQLVGYFSEPGLFKKLIKCGPMFCPEYMSLIYENIQPKVLVSIPLKCFIFQISMERLDFFVTIPNAYPKNSIILLYKQFEIGKSVLPIESYGKSWMFLDTKESSITDIIRSSVAMHYRKTTSLFKDLNFISNQLGLFLNSDSKILNDIRNILEHPTVKYGCLKVNNYKTTMIFFNEYNIANKNNKQQQSKNKNINDNEKEKMEGEFKSKANDIFDDMINDFLGSKISDGNEDLSEIKENKDERLTESKENKDENLTESKDNDGNEDLIESNENKDDESSCDNNNNIKFDMVEENAKNEKTNNKKQKQKKKSGK